MLKVGVVGLKNSSKYLSAIKSLDNFILTGIYDPSFQIDLSLYNKVHNGILNLTDLIDKSDLIIFTTDDKVFFPLVKQAICKSKVVFLDSIFKFTPEQINILIKLEQEANVGVHILHKTIYNDVVQEFLKLNQQPLLYESELEIDETANMLRVLREETSNVLFYMKSSIRKVRVNILAANGEIPDIYNVCIDFNNGCFSKILVSSLKMPEKNHIKIFSVNRRFELDLINQTIHTNNQLVSPIFSAPKYNNTNEKLIAKQLDACYYNILQNCTSNYLLDYELEAYKVVQAVTDKLKVCMIIV